MSRAIDHELSFSCVALLYKWTGTQQRSKIKKQFKKGFDI